MKRKLEHLLDIRGMTSKELAKRSGLHRNVISGLLNDDNPNPKLDTIKRIASALHVSPSYFLEENAYTPLEALELPNDIKQFILNLDSMDYLILAQKLEEKKIPTTVVEKIVSAYEEVINKTSPSKLD